MPYLLNFRLMAELTLVQRQITDLLHAGHTLTVRWDCGGDESFVYTQVDDKEVKANYLDDNDLHVLMNEYITEILDLPAAGDFSVQGTGHIFQEGKEIIISYQSQATTYWEDDDYWKSYLTAEQKAHLRQLLGLSPLEEEPVASKSNNENASAKSGISKDEHSQQEGTYNPNMSDDYSGRRILFTLS